MTQTTAVNNAWRHSVEVGIQGWVIHRSGVGLYSGVDLGLYPWWAYTQGGRILRGRLILRGGLILWVGLYSGMGLYLGGL